MLDGKVDLIMGSSLRGSINTFSTDEAQAVASAQRAIGLAVRINDRGLTQGRRIYPITVSWWVKPSRRKT